MQHLERDPAMPCTQYTTHAQKKLLTGCASGKGDWKPLLAAGKVPTGRNDSIVDAQQQWPYRYTQTGPVCAALFCCRRSCCAECSLVLLHLRSPRPAPHPTRLLHYSTPVNRLRRVRLSPESREHTRAPLKVFPGVFPVAC